MHRSSLFAATLLSAVLCPPALAGPPCVDGCAADAHGGCRRATRYACELKVETKPVEKSCAIIETEAVCIPPILTSPFGCGTPFGRLKTLLTGRRGTACTADGCAADGCEGRSGPGRRKPGWFADLTNHGCGSCGSTRCVNRLGSHEYECGTRCVYEWSAVAIGDCGRTPDGVARGYAPTTPDDWAPAWPAMDTDADVPPGPAPMPTLIDEPAEPQPSDAAPPAPKVDLPAP
ncbi:MAG: hypothetical protein AAF907_11185, partial [Planctomycetota bacterium]